MRNNTLQSIQEWFATVKPNPTDKDIAAQVGRHYGKVAKMLEITDNFSGHMYFAAQAYKGKADAVKNFDKPAMLNALCDQIITAIGVGYMLGFDMQGALDKANRSNWSNT